MARRSARIASATKAPTASAAPQLGSLAEHEEYSSTPTKKPTLRHNAVASSPGHHPAPPAVATPVKLPMSEMHPSKVHPTTAAPSSGLKLGFTDIDYSKSYNKGTGPTQSTPSKTPLPSGDFTFRYNKPNGIADGDKGLTPAAQKMMEEIRKQAVNYRDEVAAEFEQEKEEAKARKIRQAKGKAGRYSAVHMAEFKKMDSIADHPSVIRAAATAAHPPMKGSLKRTQSKANLDESGSVQSKKPSTRLVPSSPEKQQEQPESPVKRARQRLDDDVSTLRPVSRDGSFIPRPKSSGNDSTHSSIPRPQNLAHLMTPTKSSLARANVAKTPSVTLVKSPSKVDLHSLAKSPSKPDIASLAQPTSKKGFGGFKSLASNNLNVDDQPTRIQTPGRFDRVKSILKRQMGGSKPKSNIPKLAASASKTSLHQGIDEEPQVPLTTPGRKLQRRVEFTPISKRPAVEADSPSPVKSSIPRAKVSSRPQSSSSATDKSTNDKTSEGAVAYPDLSAYTRDAKETTEQNTEQNTKQASTNLFPESVPGTFTFRSDHTIRFDSASPKGFGAGAGQASLRHVRQSILPMPGSFPQTSDGSPNKENNAPVSGIPHGMSNKKRHRASWDEEEEQDESAQRAAKKSRKEPSVEGHALVAPRLVGQESPIKKLTGPPTPSPQKKKTGGLSMSRLNMLARPKVRK